MSVTPGSFQIASEMRLTKGFSKYHGHLLDLSFLEMDAMSGGRRTKKSRKAPVLEQGGNILTLKDLGSLTEMVEMEFIASLRQQLYGQTIPHTSDSSIWCLLDQGNET